MMLSTVSDVTDCMLLTFSDHLIKYGMWPAAILLLCLCVLIIFRRKIEPIFDKIGPAIDRVKKAGPIELTSAPSSQRPIDVRTESPRKIFHPLDSPLLNERGEAIRKEIENLFPNDMTARVNTLITHLAATQLVLAFESINKLIWGSQLELLLYVNSQFNGAAIDELKVFYERAAAAHPTGLKDYPFDSYLGFLINSGLLIRTNGRVYITPFAKEFLAHLARSGATHPRPL
jgi:hypothetical protein